MNNENLSSAKRETARQLYARYGKSISETAQLVSVTEAAIRKWIKEGSWDIVRTSLSISRTRQLELLYAAVQKLNERIDTGEADVKDVDKVLKYTSAIRNLDTDNSIYAIVEAAELFVAWLYERDMALAQVFTREFDLFVAERRAA
jgi:predicted transcriptional regulator